jgi:Integrase zinc binding domain
LPARQRDGSARSTAAASRCWRHEGDEQCTMDSRACSRAAATLVQALYCSAGHEAYEARLGAIKEYVVWTTMAKDVKVFVQNCLHCVATIPGNKMPLPLGTQLHATKPNEILHFDFLYIGLSRNGKYQYFLLLKDDLRGYLWLVPCRTADAAATVDALMRWFAVFGVVLL